MSQPFFCRKYYSEKAALWISTDSIPLYLIKVEKVLESEKKRVDAYLHCSTEEKLQQAIIFEMLDKHQLVIYSGCKPMMANDQLEDLNRVFRLFSKVNDGLQPIAMIVCQHIIQRGDEKCEQYKESSTEEEDDSRLVKDFLNLHAKYDAIMKEEFGSHALFQKAVKDAFMKLMNQEVGKQKPVELLASFCDRLLKTGSAEKLSDSELEAYLDGVVQLFVYLVDKDVFNDLHRTQLSKRSVGWSIGFFSSVTFFFVDY